METLFTFKTPLKYIEVKAKDAKEAFLKLGKKQRLTFTSLHCDDTGIELSDSEVYGLFGHEVSL